MTENWFYIDKLKHIIENNGYTELNKYSFNNRKDWKKVCKRLNEQHEYIMDLKKTLNLYREKMSCDNCKYHNYDWCDDGDEFEVCDKGNNECLYDGFCKDYEEMD